MGLDNGFVLRFKDNPSYEVELAYFRKYYELDEYFPNQGEDVIVSKEDLVKLQLYIEPIYKLLKSLPKYIVEDYDNMGYPETGRWRAFENNDFTPLCSQSAFAGIKLMRLYERLDGIIEILENDFSGKFEIYFYSSF